MTNLQSTAAGGRSKRLRQFALIAPLAVAGSAMVSSAVSAGQDDNVTLCHATGSASNPYVVVTVDAAGAFNGHIDDPNHQNGEDIIPPFMYQGQTYSQNWDEEGMAILENDCMLPGQTTTTSGGGPTTTSGSGPTTTGGGVPTSTLADTGGADANVIGAAVLLVLGGGVALVAARRRTA